MALSITQAPLYWVLHQLTRRALVRARMKHLTLYSLLQLLSRLSFHTPDIPNHLTSWLVLEELPAPVPSLKLWPSTWTVILLCFYLIFIFACVWLWCFYTYIQVYKFIGGCSQKGHKCILMLDPISLLQKYLRHLQFYIYLPWNIENVSEVKFLVVC